MTIASGTIGTSTWSISDSGALTIGAGTFNKVALVASSWPWYEYRDSITSATFTGDVVLTDNPYLSYLSNTTAYMFQDCKNMTSVTRLERIKPSSDGAYTTRNMFYGCSKLVSVGGIASLDTSRLSDTSYMFYGCTSLTSLDLSGWGTTSVTIVDRMFKLCTSLTSVNLSGWDTTSVTSMNEMFSGCTALESVDLSDFETPALRAIYDMFRNCPASVTFGTGFDTSNLNPDAPTASQPSFVESDKACENMRTHAIVVSDEQFVAMPATEKSGTWVRGLELTYYATAYRTTDGEADAFGVDVTIGVIWETSATTTTRELTVYQKLASASSYPSTPVLTESLTGDSGVTTVTVQNVGDSAYDFKVVFYDGTNYFTAYPSVSANVKLVTIDKSGNVDVAGGISYNGDLTVGGISFVENAVRQALNCRSNSNGWVNSDGYADSSRAIYIGATVNNSASSMNGHGVSLYANAAGLNLYDGTAGRVLWNIGITNNQFRVWAGTKVMTINASSFTLFTKAQLQAIVGTSWTPTGANCSVFVMNGDHGVTANMMTASIDASSVVRVHMNATHNGAIRVNYLIIRFA